MPRGPAFPRLRITWVLLSTLLVGAVSASINPVLTLYLRQELDFSWGEVTISLAGFNAVGMATSLGLGRLVDTVGGVARTFMVVTIVSSLSYVALAATDTFGWTLVTLLIGGGPALALISLLFTLLRGTGLGDGVMMYSRAAFALSWVVGPAVSTFIVQFLGFGTLFLSTAVLCLLGGFSVVASTRGIGAETGKPGGSTGTERERQADASRNPTVLLLVTLIVGFVALQAVNAISVSYLAVLVADVRSLPLPWSGVALGVCAGLEVLFLIALGRFEFLRSVKPLVVLIGACSGLFYIWALQFADSPWMFIALQVPNALFIATLMGVGMVWFQSSVASADLYHHPACLRGGAARADPRSLPHDGRPRRSHAER